MVKIIFLDIIQNHTVKSAQNSVFIGFTQRTHCNVQPNMLAA